MSGTLFSRSARKYSDYLANLCPQVLQNMGDEIYHSPSIQRALRDLLTELQELKGLYNESQSCLSDNLPFAALTCTAIEFIPPPDLQNNMETKVFLQY